MLGRRASDDSLIEKPGNKQSPKNMFVVELLSQIFWYFGNVN